MTDLQKAESPTLKSLERAITEAISAETALEPLPPDAARDELLARLQAARTELQPKAQALREADDWQRWANATVQERLIGEMEALGNEADPSAAFKRMRDLTAEWKTVAAAPRDRAERSGTGSGPPPDVIRARFEPVRAQQSAEQADHLARKVALCEKAEALRDVHRLDSHGRRAEGAAGRVEDRRPGAPSRRTGGVGALPARLQQLLHAAPGRPEAAQGSSGPTTSTKKEALIVACRGAGRGRGPRSGVRRAEDAAGRVADDRARQEVEVRAGLAALPRGGRQGLRSLSQSRCAGAGRSCGSSRVDRHRAREPRRATGEAAANRASSRRVRSLRTGWQQAGALPARLGPRAHRPLRPARLARSSAASPATFRHTELDIAGQSRTVRGPLRTRRAARGHASPCGARGCLTRGGAPRHQLREALAANTIGGRVDEERDGRRASYEVRAAQDAWRQVGFVPDADVAPLAARFQRACQRFYGNRRPSSSGPGQPGARGPGPGPPRPRPRRQHQPG